MKIANQKWRNYTGKVFDESIVNIVEKAIKKEQKDGYRLKICVGSDSQAHKFLSLIHI